MTTDPEGHSTTNTWDEFGRQVKQALPLGQVSSNEFNAQGQLWKQHDFENQRTEFVYDNFGRVKAKFRFDAGSDAPSNAVCYVYNQLGQLYQVIERYGEDCTTNACDGYAALVGPPGRPAPTGWAAVIEGAARVLARAAVPALGIGFFALAMLLIPGMREAGRLMKEFYLRGGWRLDRERARLGRFGLRLANRSARKLRLPSLFWRFATCDDGHRVDRVMHAFAPEATAMLFSPDLPTKMSATPDGFLLSRMICLTLIPSAASPATAFLPNMSWPMRAIKVTAPPARAAATAWLAPLPPGTLENSPPRIVSPAFGMRSALIIMSVLELPITRIGCLGKSSDEISADRSGGIIGRLSCFIRSEQFQLLPNEFKITA